MTDFRISPMQNSNVTFVYSEREEILLNPVYQRPSDVWSLEKRQLLIDSIINGFDIPKLYFHEFVRRKQVDGKSYRYAIIDGKQRLQSIWSFIDGQFTLSLDFDYIRDGAVKAAGMSYGDLTQNYPRIARRFDATNLDIMLIQTDDLDLIEDMFLRLNEAVPLNAAEKRNAFGGPMPKAIRAVAGDLFFKDKLPYGNGRYRYYDLAAKFLYIEHNDGFLDTKKPYLDSFVRDFRKRQQKKTVRLIREVRRVLSPMTSILVTPDQLVGSVGMTVLYYLLFRESLQNNWANEITRSRLMEFDETRVKNRAQAEKDIRKADFDLLEFDRYSQSPNDALAMNFRYGVLRRHIGPR